MSIIGIIIVLIIVGALTATLVPMLLSKYTQSSQGTDRKALEAALTAIVGYTFSRGQIPCQVNAGGACVTGAAALMPPSAGPGAVPELGVNNYGVFGAANPFRMDVNDALAAVPPGNVKTLCAAAQTQLTALSAPNACQNPANGPCVCSDAACATQAPMAFVLFSTGHDRLPNLNNALGTRIYENDNRGIDNSPGANRYDDQLVSYPLSSLVAVCAKQGGMPVCMIAPPTQTITLGSSATLTASCSNNPKVAAACPTPYTWNSSDPTHAPVPSGTGGSVTPTATGNYTYTVTACNELGTGPASTQVTVTVTSASSCSISPLSPVVTYGATAQLFIASCIGSPAPAPNGYTWQVDASSLTGQPNTYTTASNLSVGSHTVAVTASTGAYASTTLTVNAIPVPSCQISPASANLVSGATSQLFSAINCTNSPTSYAWTVDGNPVGGFTSTYTTVSNLSVGSHNVAVTPSNAGGAGAAASAAVTVTGATPVPVCTPTATPPSIASGGSSALAANCTNTPTSYGWSNNTGSANPSGAGGSVTLTATTTYTVTATNGSGNSTPANVTVTVTPCSSGNTKVVVLNSSNGTSSFKIGTSSCTSNVAQNATVNAGCFANNTTASDVYLYNSNSCTGSVQKTFTLPAADTNNDGVANITILQPASGSTSQ